MDMERDDSESIEGISDTGMEYSRRATLVAIGTGVTVGLAGCSSGSGAGTTVSNETTSKTGTDTTTATPTDTSTATGTTTEASLSAQLETVRQATSQYTDVRTALRDGYRLGGPYVPGMGWHATHPQRLRAAAQNGFSLESPPILTYVETGQGLALGAVEFGAPAGAVSESPDLFSDEGADATESWHTHRAATHVYAKPDGQRTSPRNLSLQELTVRNNWAEFRPPNRQLSAGDTVSLNWGTASGMEGERTERIVDLVSTHPDLRTLHVWVHQDNPEGVFSAINPQFVPETDGDGHHGHDHGSETTQATTTQG